MLRKEEKTFFQTFVKTAKWTAIAGIACDGLILAGGYYFYYQMKNSSDFRFKVYNYDQRFADVYYRANEKYGDGNARKIDYKLWGVNEIKSFNHIDKFGL